MIGLYKMTLLWTRCTHTSKGVKHKIRAKLKPQMNTLLVASILNKQSKYGVGEKLITVKKIGSQSTGISMASNITFKIRLLLGSSALIRGKLAIV
jgi:hypothetical protein